MLIMVEKVAKYTNPQHSQTNDTSICHSKPTKLRKHYKEELHSERTALQSL